MVILFLFKIAEQVYGDQNMHDEVRRSCMDYMVGFVNTASLLVGYKV